MSTLGNQANELRETADKLDRIADVSTPWIHAKLTPMLREAANTIERVREHSMESESESESARESRYHELFGTPERAARTLAGIACDDEGCEGCSIYGAHCTYDGSALLEWLRSDAE